MKITPHAIQLSRLKAPIRGKGRPYTVDFGIAKPLYKQLLSKVVNSRLVLSRKPPTNDLLVAGLRIRGRSLLFMDRKVARRTQPNNITPVLLSVTKMVVGMEGISRPAVITLSRLNHPPVVNRVPNRLSRLVLFCASAVSLIFASCKSRFIGVILAPIGGSCLRTVFTVRASRIKQFIGLVAGGTRFHTPIIEGFLFKAKTRFYYVILKWANRITYYWPQILGRKLRLTAGFLAIYAAIFLPFTQPGKIVYADPIITTPIPQAAALLTMPTVTAVEPLQRIYTLVMPFGTYPNSFAPGNCTWGVASRLPVTWSGNANMWAANAAAQGIEESNVPKVGAIATTSGDSYLGHVAIVTATNPDGSFTVWEENYNGYGLTDERLTSTTEFPTFIYL